MRKSLRAVSLLVCAVILVSSSAALAGNNWLGTWTLDTAASKFSPGPAPKSETLTFKQKEDGIKVKYHLVDAEGKEQSGEYLSKFDGKEVPWKGNPDADTASVLRIDDNSYENTWKKGGAVTITAKVVVSPDGKTLTINQVGTDAKGRAVNNTMVLVRQ